MKAIIMAGGEGTRLSPMTEGMPKPLVPILGEAALMHIFRLLAQAGVKEAAVTLGYRAQDILRYCEIHGTGGLRLTFYTEKEPLGTAGGIRAAKEYCDSDFFVISGDAVCDLPLKDAARFHRERGAIATVVTQKRGDPTSFGGVISDRRGAVRGFAEKPPWDRVMTDCVNTGIYVFSPEIFSYIPSGVFCDLSKNVFPSLVGQGLYAFEGRGYWCDIGDIDAYYSCNFDAAEGKIGSISAVNGHCIAKGATVEGTLAGRCILGNVKVGKGAFLRDTILMDGVTVGAGAQVENAILCENVVVGADAVIPRGAVIGGETVIENGAVLPKGARVGAKKFVKAEELFLEDRIFSGKTEDIFRDFGLFLGEGTKPSPAFLLRCGAAAAEVFGSRIIFFDDGEASSDYIKNLMLCGAMSAGATATDGGEGFYSLAAFSTVKSGDDLGIFVKRVGDSHEVFFLDDRGLTVSGVAMRRVAERMRREMNAVLPEERPKDDDYYGEYIHFLVDNCKGLSEKLAVPAGAAGEALYAAASLLGGVCEIGTKNMAADGFIFVNADSGDSLDISYRAADGSYCMIDRYHATAAILSELLQRGEKRVFLPASAPHALCEMAEKAGAVVRLYGGNREPLSREEALSVLWQNDMLLLSLVFISLLGADRKIPEEAMGFATAEKALSVENAAEVLSVLAAHGADTEGGVLMLRFGSFSVRVTAKDRETVMLFAEAPTPHEAEDAIRYAEKGIAESVPSV